MKTYAIYYFSGTGNTHHAATLIQKKLEQAGSQVSLINIENNEPSDPEKSEVSIFMFPVYACAAPAIFMRYIKRLPEGSEAKAAVIAIYGNTENVPGSAYQALDQVIRMLERKQYNVFLTESEGYPFNWVQVFNPVSSEVEKKIFKQADTRIGEIARKIIKEQHFIKPCAFGHQIWSWLFWALYTAIGRRFLGKLFIADRSCTKCGKCVKVCPVGAIRLVKGIPRWNYRCEGCQRCINSCPQQAIQTSLLRFLLAMVVLVIAFIGLFSFIKGSFGGWWGAVGAFIGAHVVMYPLDKLVFLLEFVPGMRGILEFSFTKKYRRYLAPDFKPSMSEVKQ